MSTPPDAELAAARLLLARLVLQPGMLTLAELRCDAVRERRQPPSIMDGCVD